MRKTLGDAASFALATLIVTAADPALAQFNGGGDVPFQQGMSTVLNWAFVAGIAVALFSFILACVFLFMRNLIGFAGGVLGVLIGGALMANAPTIVQGLTNLSSPF
ncbi:hypothetical protein IGS68_34840 (plasmid) [Skermanella sp. TT6]|uniref:Type IV secretion system protein VirB2 n=1 Tax=Skermanella cutis TaxID=2775420 RepID=A0ABX7BM19_9PROT|nr:hypothetical protein [Skermanella sp. TT6]QQP94022.1 hypothetical protein IGS68_34840 [Skermanella sp. TT6]